MAKILQSYGMDDGWYIRNGKRIEYGMQKGLRIIILQDRESWTPGLKLDCGKELHVAADSAAEDNEQFPSTVCCARRRVINEPDFLGQREWLREVVENSGHRIMYFPKFYCEFNYIEMVWAYIKANLRRSCILLPVELDTIPIALFRSAARHCFRFMSGYRQG